MSISSQIAWDDTVLPFQLDRSNTRGRVARLDGVLDQVLAQHNYPPAIEALVAETTLLTALIGQAIKLRWKLSLQVRGDGPARMIATDYYAPTKDGQPGRLRAYASYDADRLNDGPVFDLIGKGYFAILIDQGEGNIPYQGITPIAGQSLANCAEAYFAQSEQLPTRFQMSLGRSKLAGGKQGWRAGGVMLQLMPKTAPAPVPEGQASADGLTNVEDILDAEEGEDWNRANILLDTVKSHELIGPKVQPPELLTRLFHEESPRVFDAQPVRFGCTCSSDRVRQSLSIYSAKDIAHMTTEDGKVTADCQFCGSHYEFEPESLGFEVANGADDDG